MQGGSRSDPRCSRRKALSMKRAMRRYRRQYGWLTATQKWACDWQAYLLSRMRREINNREVA